MKISVLVSAATSLIALAVAGPASAAAPDVTGTWSGQVTQISHDKPFAVSMAVTAKGGTIQYPDSACSGTLTRAGTSGDFVFFVEKITTGAYDPVKKIGCIPGSISVQKAGTGLIWGWIGSYDGQPIVVYGTLNKIAAPPATTAAKPKAKTTTPATTPAPKT